MFAMMVVTMVMLTMVVAMMMSTVAMAMMVRHMACCIECGCSGRTKAHAE